MLEQQPWRAHAPFFHSTWKKTQQHFESFAEQLGNRRAEAFACKRAVNEMQPYLMHDCVNADNEDDDSESEDEGNVPCDTETKWNYHDDKIPLCQSATGRGEYRAKSMLDNQETISFDITWKDSDKNAIKKKTNMQMLYVIQLYAISKRWDQDLNITGFASIKKTCGRSA